LVVWGGVDSFETGCRGGALSNKAFIVAQHCEEFQQVAPLREQPYVIDDSLALQILLAQDVVRDLQVLQHFAVAFGDGTHLLQFDVGLFDQPLHIQPYSALPAQVALAEAVAGAEVDARVFGLDVDQPGGHYLD
jgi:hypothetical protein